MLLFFPAPWYPHATPFRRHWATNDDARRYLGYDRDRATCISLQWTLFEIRIEGDLARRGETVGHACNLKIHLMSGDRPGKRLDLPHLADTRPSFDLNLMFFQTTFILFLFRKTPRQSACVAWWFLLYRCNLPS